MNNPLSEFQDLIALYRNAAEKLTGIFKTVDAADNRALSQSILKHRDVLTQISRMEVRASQLWDSWKAIESQLDPKSRKEVTSAIEKAKAEATRLKDLCSEHANILEAVREKLGEGLDKVGKHNQYLKCMKPVKGNFPKFIDSLY